MSQEAILSLGSNLGDRLAWLRQACASLAALPDTRLTAASPVYETDPVGVPADQADRSFLNAIVILETALTPERLASEIHRIEDRLGRVRGPRPNLPRTLDIDLLTFGALILQAPDLTLPHPRATTRRFVLQPLADLKPDLIFPGQSARVADLLGRLPPLPGVRRLADSLFSFKKKPGF